jgi:hypothetical protein
MKPDTILGGKITTLKEVFHGKTTSYVFNRIQIGCSQAGRDGLLQLAPAASVQQWCATG